MKKRLKRQYDLLSIITKSQYYADGDYYNLAKVIVKETSKLMDTNRVGVWLFDDEKQELQGVALYQDKQYQPLINLSTLECPKYISAIKSKRTIVIDDVLKSPETDELLDNYFRPSKISSLLDTVIKDGNTSVGVICMEHTGPARKWELDEINLSGILGRILGTTLTLNKKITTEKELVNAKKHLKESNITLKNVLDRIEIEKKSYNENVALNIERNITPLLEELKNNPQADRDIIKRLEIGISNLSSSFYKKLVKVNYNLSPTEVKVCQMIKGGYQGKEIAGILNLSFSTVETHKKNIRRKLEITGKSINLRVYLNELDSY